MKRILIGIIAISIILMIGYGSMENSHIVDSDKYYEKDIAENHNEFTENNEELKDEIKLKIEEMTLEEKIGQLVLVGMDGYDINENIKTLIESYHVGGVILYGRNVENSSQLLSLTNSLKDNNLSNKVPLFISVDEEGGAVSRVPNQVKKLPTARSIGKTEDTSLAFEAGILLGQTLKIFGYNMNFAPVLDIDSNPLNPIIGNRSFGQTVDIVSSMGIATLKGIESQGVIPVIKHFPGHGDTSIDSHIGLPVVNHDLERLNNFEIVPFKNAIDNGEDVVMVGHILMSQIDTDYPASMSKAVITDILRDGLAFDGVIITDDITMGAIEKNYDIGNAAIKSLKAGTDIILVGHNYENALDVLNEIKNSINSGILSVDRIDESIYRILKLKEKYKLNDSFVNDVSIQEVNYNIKDLMDKFHL